MLPSFERIIASDRSSFACRRFELEAFPFHWHVHPEAELTLILAGHGQRFVGDGIAEFGPGDLVLLGGGLPHTWHSRQAPGEAAESVVIQFRPDFLGETFHASPEMRDVRALLDRAAAGLAFTGRVAAQVGERMIEIERLRGMDRLLAFLGVLQRLAGARRARRLSSLGFDRRLRTEDRLRIDQVFRMIDEALAEPITQGDVAEAVGMTPAGFSRFFKRTTGRTFVGYVHELRVGRACRQLIETDDPVTDIAFACGFGNLSHFNRLFRRHKGVPPREYRASFRR